ncbi:MAG: hypothetical protein ACI9XO_000598 [Paraglaciecola sp.]|jgi:hypothetical protein
MTDEKLEALRFPIGRLNYDSANFVAKKTSQIQTLEGLPQKIRDIVAQLSEADLNMQYRPDGWTGRQVIHHVVDSHMNAYIRFKWALTEDSPVIKAYDEAAWAELSDYMDTPVEVSLSLLENLHKRWVILLKKMTEEQWNNEIAHPDWTTNLNMKFMLGMYDWHSRHHLGHLFLIKNG